MSIDLDLLKRAWPKGYLPIRGVMTRKGWQCVDADKIICFKFAYRTLIVSWKANDPPYETYSMSDWGRHENWKAIQRGEFLPNVDPNDVATWACLLQDLVAASEPHQTLTGVQATWEPRPWPHEGSSWGIYWKSYEGSSGATYFNFDDIVDDPGKALVLAKIQLNENAGRS